MALVRTPSPRPSGQLHWRFLGSLLLLISAVLFSGCATVGNETLGPYSTDEYQSGQASSGGYVHAEATNFVEFCVELDNQDDRLLHPESAEAQPKINDALWDPHPIYDSREAVATDYIAYKRSGSPVAKEGEQRPNDDDLAYWWRVFAQIEGNARRTNVDDLTAEKIQSNANLNGFGPWQNAWLLYQGRGPNAGKYAIAIRGTVFSNTPSAVEDIFFQPVMAKSFLSDAVSFSDSSLASIHSGFAHAAFTTLLDSRYGILPVLDKKVPARSELFVVGHSQGAAMATLVHAFFYHAMRDADRTGRDPFGLKGKAYRLKSYAFAQPKPGNAPFAAEFARFTQSVDDAIVINNDIDPVPKVPFTMQGTEDLATDFHGRFLVARTVHFFSAFGKSIRRLVSAIGEPIVRKSAAGYGRFYRYDSIKPVGTDRDRKSVV